MKYDAVVFDLDGTLIDTLEDLMDSVNYALAEFGFPARTYEEIRTFVGNGVRRLVYLSVPEGTPDDVSEKCLDVFKAHYLHNSRNKTKPYKGIPELLKAIFAAGFKTAVVTNKMQDAAVDIVRGFFGDSIHNLTTITSKRVCSSKPQFAILERHTDVINQRDEVVLSYDSVVMIKTKRDDK